MLSPVPAKCAGRVLSYTSSAREEAALTVGLGTCPLWLCPPIAADRLSSSRDKPTRDVRLRVRDVMFYPCPKKKIARKAAAAQSAGGGGGDGVASDIALNGYERSRAKEQVGGGVPYRSLPFLVVKMSRGFWGLRQEKWGSCNALSKPFPRFPEKRRPTAVHLPTPSTAPSTAHVRSLPCSSTRTQAII